MLEVETERDRHERQQREQVALLEAGRSVRRVERRLEEQSRCERRGERREGGLGAPARTRESDQRARYEDGPRDEDEQEAVDRRPVGELPADVQVGDPRVVAEHVRRADCERTEHRQYEERERQALCPHDAAPVDHQRRDEERGGQHHVLDAREGRKEREAEERELGALRRLLDRDDACVDRGQREREGDRVGERVAREDEVWHRDRERCAGERVASGEAEAPREQIDRHGCERHEERVLELGQAVGRLRREEGVERRRQQRLEQRREVRRLAPHGRRVAGAEGAGDGRVDVLVREVAGRGVGGRADGAEQERDADDERQTDVRGQRLSEAAAERARAGNRGQGSVEGHPTAIGRTALGLDARRRHEELAVRALEPAVALGCACHQVGLERLLAVGAGDLARRGVVCRLLGHRCPGYLRILS